MFPVAFIQNAAYEVFLRVQSERSERLRELTPAARRRSERLRELTPAARRRRVVLDFWGKKGYFIICKL